MPKDEWGVKRICPSCETRFYDLQRDPMTCPNCDASFDLDSLTSKKGPQRADKKEPVAAAPVAAETEEEDVVLDDADDSDTSDVDIGDELLEDDEDDSVSLEEIADVPADDDDS